MRNRAVEIFVDPLPLPSLEAEVLAGSDSTPAFLFAPKVANFHQAFLKTIHNVNSVCVNAQVCDALASGSPSLVPFLKCCKMLSNEATSQEVAVSIEHKYLRNRTNILPHHRAELSKQLDECPSDLRPHCGLHAAFTLASNSMLPLSTLQTSRQSLFLRIADSDVQLHSAAFFFVLEQCYDSFFSETKQSLRSAVLSSRNQTAAFVQCLLSSADHHLQHQQLMDFLMSI